MKQVDTYFKIILYLYSAWAKVLVRVVELLDAIQVCVRWQMNWLLGFEELHFVLTLSWSCAHCFKGIGLHQDVVWLATLEIV